MKLEFVLAKGKFIDGYFCGVCDMFPAYSFRNKCFVLPKVLDQSIY